MIGQCPNLKVKDDHNKTSPVIASIGPVFIYHWFIFQSNVLKKSLQSCFGVVTAQILKLVEQIAERFHNRDRICVTITPHKSPSHAWRSF